MSNTQRALAALRDMIFDGRLAPGSDHLESELAETLGMSRTPVREAAVTLANQGLVEIRPRRGLRITALNPADMEEIYEILTALETLAVRRAAELGTSKDQMAELSAIIEQMEAALATQDLDQWAVSDEVFHAALVNLSGNQRLSAMCRMYTDQVRRARLTTLKLRPIPHQSNADHKAVVDAIRAGDAETACARHMAHRATNKRIILDLLIKLGPPTS